MVASNNIDTIGGIEQHISQLSSALQQQSIIVKHLSSTRQFFLTKKIPRINDFRKVLSDFNVVHFHGFSAIFVVLLAFFSKKQKKTKWIYTPHRHPFSKHRRPIYAKLFFNVFTKQVLKKMDKVIVLSTQEKAFFLNFIPDNKIIIIPNSIQSINTEIAAKNMRKSFLFVGRYDSNKRPYLIEKIAPLFPQYNFIFVTDRQDLITKNNLIYHHNVSQATLSNLYANSLATIVVSQYEAFSIVALESLAAGTPIIISENVQIKEYINDTVMTLILEKYIEKNLIQAVEKIIHIKDELFHQSCQEATQIAQKFLWKNTIHQILNYYQ